MLNWPLAELLPHAGDMILLDRIEQCDEERIVTHLQVRDGGLFNQADGSYPAWLGVELMAQSIAAYAGVRAKRAARPVEQADQYHACDDKPRQPAAKESFHGRRMEGSRRRPAPGVLPRQ